MLETGKYYVLGRYIYTFFFLRGREKKERILYV